MLPVHTMRVIFVIIRVEISEISGLLCVMPSKSTHRTRKSRTKSPSAASMRILNYLIIPSALLIRHGKRCTASPRHPSSVLQKVRCHDEKYVSVRVDWIPPSYFGDCPSIVCSKIFRKDDYVATDQVWICMHTCQGALACSLFQAQAPNNLYSCHPHRVTVCETKMGQRDVCLWTLPSSNLHECRTIQGCQSNDLTEERLHNFLIWSKNTCWGSLHITRHDGNWDHSMHPIVRRHRSEIKIISVCIASLSICVYKGAASTAVSKIPGYS